MSRDPDCIFCKIVAGNVPVTQVYRDEHVLAVEDVNPQAPVHVLVMPLEHYATLGEIVNAGRGDIADALLRAANSLGSQRGAGGFRLVVNTGSDGGQTVGHAHVHVLAGLTMHWPPG